MTVTTPSSLHTLIAINAREGATTSFIQDGTGFVAGTTATVADLTPMPNQFTFDTVVQVISTTRLVITVTCHPPTAPNAPLKLTTIQVTTANPDHTQATGDAFLVVLRTCAQPAVDRTGLTTQRLVQKKGVKSVVFLPVTGFGDNINALVTANSGKWAVVKVKQLKKTPRVKVTLKCTDDTAERKLRGPQPFTPSLSITLISDDDTTLDVPAVPVTYVSDPDEVPDD